MKKLLLLVVIAFAFTACDKCQDCDCSNATYEQWESQEVCKSDYDSNDDYNEVIAAFETWGCNCN